MFKFSLAASACEAEAGENLIERKVLQQILEESDDLVQKCTQAGADLAEEEKDTTVLGFITGEPEWYKNTDGEYQGDFTALVDGKETPYSTASGYTFTTPNVDELQEITLNKDGEVKLVEDAAFVKDEDGYYVTEITDDFGEYDAVQYVPYEDGWTFEKYENNMLKFVRTVEQEQFEDYQTVTGATVYCYDYVKGTIEVSSFAKIKKGNAPVIALYQIN